MKYIISIILLFQSYIYACSLCATDIPQIRVDAQITYNKDKTSFDIKWEFHKEFVSSLTQYDTNENGVFEKEEQELIKDSLVSYLENMHHLTDIEYKKINKLTEPRFIETIIPTLSELEFGNDTMIYHYKFDLPFVLQNKYKLYLGFNDENGNFNFSIKNVTLNNYSYAYSLEKKLINTTITLNDSSIVTTQNTSVKKDNQIQVVNKSEALQPKSTYIQILSEQLTKLKNDLKSVLKDIKQNNTISSYIWLLLFSFLYGILHAIGPGHGKSLVSSYFISQEKSYLKAFSIASLIGVVHTFSAFILTVVVYYSVDFIFNSTIVNVEQIATKVSAVIIILIALYLLSKKLKKTKTLTTFTTQAKQVSPLSPNIVHTQTLSCGCNSCKTTSTDLGVILAAGIIPCPGTVTIFLFTMSLGIYFVGFLSAIFMSAGMSLIIFITAILSVKIRKSTSNNKTIVKFFEYGSLIFILCLGIILFVVS